MGSALSTGGGLTESQKKRADQMEISYSEMLQMMLNKQKIETKLVKASGVHKASPVTKKKTKDRSHSRKSRYL